MKVRYVNQQDDSDPMNRTAVAGSDELAKLPDKTKKIASYFLNTGKRSDAFVWESI
jgi:hypothetical protein